LHGYFFLWFWLNGNVAGVTTFKHQQRYFEEYRSTFVGVLVQRHQQKSELHKSPFKGFGVFLFQAKSQFLVGYVVQRVR